MDKGYAYEFQCGWVQLSNSLPVDVEDIGPPRPNSQPSGHNVV